MNDEPTLCTLRLLLNLPNGYCAKKTNTLEEIFIPFKDADLKGTCSNNSCILILLRVANTLSNLLPLFQYACPTHHLSLPAPPPSQYSYHTSMSPPSIPPPHLPGDPVPSPPTTQSIPTQPQYPLPQTSQPSQNIEIWLLIRLQVGSGSNINLLMVWRWHATPVVSNHSVNCQHCCDICVELQALSQVRIG